MAKPFARDLKTCVRCFGRARSDRNCILVTSGAVAFGKQLLHSQVWKLFFATQSVDKGDSVLGLDTARVTNDRLVRNAPRNTVELTKYEVLTTPLYAVQPQGYLNAIAGQNRAPRTAGNRIFESCVLS